MSACASIRMTRICLGAMLATVAVLVGGCSGSAPSRPSLALAAYVVRAGEEPGFQLTGSPRTVATVSAFDLGDPHAQTSGQQLRSAGFRRGVSQPTGSLRGEGVSTAIELASPRAAEGLLTSSYGKTPPESPSSGAVVHSFAVPGIPNVVATSIETSAGSHAANVLFREGRCVLIVGDAISGSDYEKPLDAAARAVYERTNRRRGVCTN